MPGSTDLSNRIVIVTGAASGIGAATVEKLIDAGAMVVAVDREPVRAGAALAFQMSVTDEQQWVSTVSKTVDRFGRIDGVVNCAGIIRMSAVTEMALEDFRLLMQVNVEGPFLSMKHVLPIMYGQRSGSVVNISSTAGIAGSAGASAYCASKAAVRLLSKAVALEAIGARSGVRVNSVHPAMTQTPMVKDIVDQLGGGDAIVQQMRALQPAGEFIPVSAVVDSILFLLSDASAYVNGAELLVDNGFTAQ